MQQFDICSTRSAGRVKLVLVLQHDWLTDQKTVVVAPVMPEEEYQRVAKLHPVFEYDGNTYIAALDLMMTVQRPSLGPTVTSLADRRDIIKRGIDTLFDGF